VNKQSQSCTKFNNSL